MNEIYILYLSLHLEDGIKSGYLGNETTINIKLNIRIIDDEEFIDGKEGLVFFLSMRYAQQIVSKLQKLISDKYKNSTVDYDIRSIDISNELFNKMMIDPWKFDKA